MWECGAIRVERVLVVVGGRGALCAGAVVEPLEMLAFILVVWRKVCDSHASTSSDLHTYLDQQW